MATWVTHLMVADKVLERLPGLDRHGFCVGNIAPDCNVENEDWTEYTPPRAVTHWMGGERKAASDCDRFYQEYIEKRRLEIKTEEEYSFLLGYYAHLITDAEFQRYIRDENRVAAAWQRIRKHPELAEKSVGMPENWDSVKRLIDQEDRRKDIYRIEADYLERHPESGYFTEILNLKTFPDYIDYLPTGAIVRKIGVMGYLPGKEESRYPYIGMTREEYAWFVEKSVELVAEALHSFRNR
ncbi:MAG: zinc dependent phospholipase C family protein [Roseburia sp.]|nr:zinc dependent phospholipase C family protein [Roseburia sp.]MCM1097419.1 zinc dependent phospholipase C family protein [Ruminococcus flavefaciens]